MAADQNIREAFNAFMTAVADFFKENQAIRRDAAALVRTTQERAEKKDLLHTLHLIDKI